MATCFQNLPLDGLSNRSAPSVLVGALFKKFGLFLNTPCIHTHAHPVGPFWMSGQLVTEDATYTTHNKHERRTSMPLAGFKPVVPVMERLQTYDLFRFAATSCHFQQCSAFILIPVPLMLCILDTAKVSDKLHKCKQCTFRCGPMFLLRLIS